MEEQPRNPLFSSSSPPSPISDHRKFPPPSWRNRKTLSKQLSMREVPREKAWERRRRQFLRKRNSDPDLLSDEDLKELKGCIELGFGFTEQNAQDLCSTIPALDLYFAVKRQFSCCPSPHSDSMKKIITPGEDPYHIKTKLRHWAQAVACSLKQSS